MLSALPVSAKATLKDAMYADKYVPTSCILVSSRRRRPTWTMRSHIQEKAPSAFMNTLSLTKHIPPKITSFSVSNASLMNGTHVNSVALPRRQFE